MLWMFWKASLYMHSWTAYKCMLYLLLSSQLLFHDLGFPYLHFNPQISYVLVTAEDLLQLSWGDSLALGRLGCKFFFHHKLCLILASLASSLSQSLSVWKSNNFFISYVARCQFSCFKVNGQKWPYYNSSAGIKKGRFSGLCTKQKQSQNILKENEESILKLPARGKWIKVSSAVVKWIW